MCFATLAYRGDTESARREGKGREGEVIKQVASINITMDDWRNDNARGRCLWRTARPSHAEPVLGQIV
jgi:hypothetical protein